MSNSIGIGIGMGVGGIGIVSGGGGGGFPVNAVHFDGANDFLRHNAVLTGSVDNSNFLTSIWVNLTGGAGLRNVFALCTSRVRLFRNNAKKYQITLGNGSVNFVSVETDELYDHLSANPGWHHILVAAQLTATPVFHFYIDDIAIAITFITGPDTGTITWVASDQGIGATPVTGAGKLDADVSELYVTNEFLDISVEANRRKFIDASGKPVDLGSDGSIPTSTAALVFHSGDTDAWHTNKGSGGGFVENGALTDATSSPND